MTRFARRCRHPTCARDTKAPSGYCEAHAAQAGDGGRSDADRARDAKRRAGADYQRRQSFYDSEQWRNFRRAILRARKNCEIKGPTCRTKATCVDHIVAIRAGGAALDPSNVQAACWSCHSAKTAREDGGFGNARTQAQTD